MNKTIEKYGLKAVEWPKIKASKSISLKGEEGKQIVKSETKLILTQHRKTFSKLAFM